MYWPAACSIHFRVRCANLFRMLCDATEAYTHGNQSFTFLDIPVEQTEEAEFWAMQQNCSQVSCLRHSSLLPIVLLHSVSLCHSSNLIVSKRKQRLLWCALVQPCAFTTNDRHWFAIVRMAYSGNKLFRVGPNTKIRSGGEGENQF